MPRVPVAPPAPKTVGADEVKSKKDGTHVGFILLHDYSMIAFANAVETLRMANYISRRPLYRWTVVNPEQASAPGAHKIFTSKEIPGQVIDVLIVHKAVAEARPEDVASIVRGWMQPHFR